jgi:hypothetical protein
MQPVLIQKTNFPLITNFSQPSTAMAVYAVVYFIVFTALALRQFNKRDL